MPGADWRSAALRAFVEERALVAAGAAEDAAELCDRAYLAQTEGAGDREARIEAAREVWRRGFIAEALVRQAQRPTLDTSGEHHTGTLTADDLAALEHPAHRPASSS